MELVIFMVLCIVTHQVTFLRGLSGTRVRLGALEEAWETEGPLATLEGRLRARLAALTWLGPLRPDPPRDPFLECGLAHTSGSWWSGLLRLTAARRRLDCLEQHMAEARAHHALFKNRLWVLSFLAGCVVAGIAAVFLRMRKKKRQKGLEVARSSWEAVVHNAVQRLQPSPEVRRRSRRQISLLRRMKTLFKGKSKSAGKRVSDDSLLGRRPEMVGHSPLQEPVVHYGLIPSPEVKRRSQRQISLLRWLKARFKGKGKRTGKKVSDDSLEGHRKGDDGQGKLAEQADVLPCHGLDPPTQSRRGCVYLRTVKKGHHQLCTLPSPRVLLQAVNLLLLMYLCLSRGSGG